jgi:hypothetical protein
MSVFLKIMVFMYFAYESKEFFSQGGFSNPIAFSLYKMFFISLIQHVIPQNIFTLIENIKQYLKFIENVKNSANGNLADTQCNAPQAYLGNNRSLSKNRKNRFNKETYSD